MNSHSHNPACHVQCRSPRSIWSWRCFQRRISIIDNQPQQNPRDDTLTAHMLHVWYIYQHLPKKSPSFVGKYTIHGAYGQY